MHLAEGVTRAVTTVIDLINRDASSKGRVIEFRDLFYAYVHTDPRHGITYILDLLLLYKRYKGKKMTVKVRRHVYLRQALLPVLVRAAREPGDQGEGLLLPALVSGDPAPGLQTAKDHRPTVHIIVPIAGEGKLEVLTKFLANYENEVLSPLEPASLIMVVFAESPGSRVERAVREGVEALEINYPGYSFTIKVLEEEFSRGVGLMAGLQLCLPHQLTLLMDLDIQVSGWALHHVRKLTKRGTQIYFPIVFSQLQDRGGYWRDFGYGIVAAYKQDLDTVGGLNTFIKGWGKEDVDLYDRLLQHTNLTLFRAASPFMTHLYHPVSCSPSLPGDQAAMCATSRANTFLSLPALVNTVLNSSLLAG